MTPKDLLKEVTTSASAGDNLIPTRFMNMIRRKLEGDEKKLMIDFITMVKQERK